MEIKVLGTGCTKCKTLLLYTQIAIDELGIKTDIIKVEDIAEIMKYGVMATPALVIDDKVVIVGKVSTVGEIKNLLS